MYLQKVGYGDEEADQCRLLQAFVVHPGHCAAVMYLGLLLYIQEHTKTVEAANSKTVS